MKIDKGDVLGWAAVIGGVGVLIALGYWGVKKITNPVKSAEDLLEDKLGKTGSMTKPTQPDIVTEQVSESAVDVANMAAIEADPAVQKALKDYNRELHEYATANQAYLAKQGDPPGGAWAWWAGNGGWLEERNKLYNTAMREYDDVVQAAERISETSGGRIKIQMAQE
ncbi:MAG: hypothetical protein A2Z29_04735 [Chloroflexi bacterium RBG_16_56_11]|nr:MAG: hypothetical protein A2Z29_04735 [Chloroflexi bacterium RBG_16_56_11]